MEAYGRPGMYVVMAQVMRRANISDPEEFRAIAEYLEERGWIAEADPDYGVFVLTPEGIEGTLGPGLAPVRSQPRAPQRPLGSSVNRGNLCPCCAYMVNRFGKLSLAHTSGREVN